MAASMTMRVAHRYLGFFLAGIMLVYALSGTLLIFRRTDFLKQAVVTETQLAAGMEPAAVGEALKVKNIEVERREGSVVHFRGGTYDAESGLATQTKKEYPYLIDQMVHLHKATTNDPLYYLNIFFGMGLLFFVVSAFFMFMPGSTILRKGLWFTAAGVVLTLLLLLV